MSNELFFTDDNRYLSSYFFKEITTTYTSQPDDINPYGTQFFISIRETGWIDEKNVYLVTDGHYIPAKYVTRGCFEEDPETHYSIFFSSYHYKEPCKQMEAHWYYRIGYTTYSTSSIIFEVLPS